MLGEGNIDVQSTLPQGIYFDVRSVTVTFSPCCVFLVLEAELCHTGRALA